VEAMQKIREQVPSPFAQARSVDINSDLPRFKHTWSRHTKGKLDSSCSRCHAIIAMGKDEMTLLATEHKHRCESLSSNEDIS